MLFGANAVLFGANAVLFGANAVLFGANAVLFGANAVLLLYTRIWTEIGRFEQKCENRPFFAPTWPKSAAREQKTPLKWQNLAALETSRGDTPTHRHTYIRGYSFLYKGIKVF